MSGQDRNEPTLQWLAGIVAPALDVAASSLDPDERLHRYGLTSLTATSIISLVAERFGRPLAPTLLWDRPTLRQLAAFLDGAHDADTRPPIVPLSQDEPIAIIGMACRLPGADSLHAFWRMLASGADSIATVPPDRWSIEAFCDPDPQAAGRMATPWGGFIANVDQFDAGFFGMSPREAAQADPQQRLALELAWEALEDAGIRARAVLGTRTGVFLGAMWSDYARLLCDRDAIAQHTATGQDISIISARIAYVLGLEGPALTIGTACSSALVAVHQACRSIRAGESTIALAGGVHLLLAPESSIAMTKFGAMAPDGRCKPFDARANGYVRGEGGGLVVLKPLALALASHDRIYAVIRGSAVNNDGPSNGLTAPNPSAQRNMLRDALGAARINPLEVDYVEAHGTGTALGDPIEAQALADILCHGRTPARPLRIGSVKSNIGHLEAAAGAAGLIKLALALHHRWIPASLHYQAPNPAIDFQGGALAVQANAGAWPGAPDAASSAASALPVGGVSSFGFGGTNCHVLLQAAPARTAANTETMRPVFVFAGNGGNWAGMAHGLAAEPVFAATLAACDTILANLGYPFPLAEVLDDGRVTDVALGQPALCAVQIALASFLGSLGINPAAVVGHSVGEVAAACVAGALTPQQALHLVVARSRLQASVAGQGGMALAAAPAEAVRTLLPPGIVVAGENGPRATLLAGPCDAIAAVCDTLDRAGITSQPIDVPVAYHSPQMDPLRPRLEQELASLAPRTTDTGIVSTVTGGQIDGAGLTAVYWGRNLRDPVRFRQAIQTLLDAGHRSFVELSPHPLLAPQIRQMAPDALVITPLRRGQSDAAAARLALAPLSGKRRGVRPRHLLVLSARSAPALESLRLQWAARLPMDFPDLCHTALVGRERFAWRLALHAADGEEACRRLLASDVVRGEARPGVTPQFNQVRGASEDWTAYLDRCAAAFVAGADIDGTRFDAEEPWQITDAPTYPFERERHWLAQPDAGLTYTVAWEPFTPAPDRSEWPPIRPVADPPDRALDAQATAFALAALAAVPPAEVAPRHVAFARRLARWTPLQGPPPTDSPAAALVHRAGTALPALLAGHADPLEVLFPDGDLEAAAAVYRSAPFAAAQHALAGIIGALGRPLRVLELGAGTGALTEHLVTALPPDSFLLCTDVSDAFLAALRRRFAHQPAVRTARFDIDQPTPLDGPFDAVVATNVLHAGASIGDILVRLRGLLAPDGVLAVVEMTQAPRWVELVFGLTEGWWRFRGDPARPEHALMGAPAWHDALAAAGFTAIDIRPDGDAHALILARAPAQAGNWRLAGRHAGWADAYAAASRPSPQAPTGTLYLPGDTAAPSLLAELTALCANAPPVTIVHNDSLPHAAIAGAARALSLDHPGSISTSFQLMDDTDATIDAVRGALGHTGHEEQLRVTAGTISVARLVRVTPRARAQPLDPDRLHVVAGGSGRLGREITKFLIGRGARHLLLASRSPTQFDPETARGASVRTLALDLTLPAAHATLRTAFDRPLGAIVHAAGLADGALEAVLAAKLAVAETLEKAAQGLDPAFLLLFSSAAGVWGTRGHPAYAAANRALDHWAEQARARGVPATAVAFGRFQEPGLLSAQEDAALDAAGLRAMPPAQAFDAALHAVAEGAPQRIVADVDWPRFRATFEARKPRTLFSHFNAAPSPRPPTHPAAATGRTTLDRAGIARLLADLLGHPDATRIDPDRGFFEQGLDSLTAVALRRRLEDTAGTAVPAAVLFAHPTVSALAAWLAGAERHIPAATQPADTHEPIAIVGMACRFPGGANDPDGYFGRLLSGEDAIRPVPDSRPTANLWQAAPPSVRNAGFLDGVEQFDAAFFGISPREAAQLDPQQRLLLEVAWQALEHAGVAPDRLNGSRTGVFVGATGSDYANLARSLSADALDAHSLVGQPNNTLAGRLAYQFGLHGPTLTVDTACSSSLVAVHLAVRALRHGEADAALAGGVNLLLTPDTSVMLARSGLLATDGRCKAFDAAANGYVRGEGCGVIVLKTLSRARQDGDRVLALIRGTAVNHDGRSSSFTAPNGTAQAAVIRDALTDGGLAPDAIDFVEAHGTGTALGDPIELDALAEVFTGRSRPLPVGSVKSAIGHAEAAAGIAGLIKAVQCLRARTLTPQMHYATRNPHARADTAVSIAAGESLPKGICRAGVSAFGASGTNGHVVLEAFDEPPSEQGDGPSRLLLTAATPDALERLRADTKALLPGKTSFADACHTASVGRARLAHWLLADSLDGLETAAAHAGPPPDLPVPRGRRVTLPLTPFDRLPFWLLPQAAATAMRPVLGPPHRSARSGETVWETRLDAETAWLRDHIVDHEVVLPAAAFIDMARSAGLAALRDVEFRHRLAVPPAGIAAQLVLDRDGVLTLYAEDGDGWTEIATARLAGPDVAGLNVEGAEQPVAPEGPSGQAGHVVSGTGAIAALSARGFDFGPAYRITERLLLEGRHARADLVRDDGRALDPPLIDAALQSLTALLPSADRPWLPASIATVAIGPSPAGTVTATARLTAHDQDHATGDAWLLRADGSVVIQLAGVTLRPVNAEPGAWYHDVCWRPDSADTATPAGRWHAIGPGSASIGADSHDPTGDGQLPDAAIIVDLRPLSAPTAADCVTATAALARAAAALPRPPQIILVSRGASAAPPVAPGAPPAAAVLMGLQPVIDAEYPRLRCRWLDLDVGDSHIPAAMGGPAGRFALRHGRLLAPEVVKAAPPPLGPVRLAPGPERSFADLRLMPESEPVPAAGQIVINVEAVGLNFKDVLNVLGRAASDCDGLGLECAGTVRAVGEEVSHLKLGDAVMGFGSGVLASRAVLPANRVLPRPPWLDVDTAATLAVAGLTAWHGLRDLASIRPGMRVLIHAGAGGVGNMAIRLAHLWGARVFATTSTGKATVALAAGAEAVGDSRSTAFVETARRWAGHDGFDIVLNALGPDIANPSAALLGPSGLFLEIGNAPRPAAAPRYAAYDLDQPMRADPGWFTDRMRHLIELLHNGSLQPPVRTVLPLAQAGEAFQALGQGRTVGKLVLRLPQAVLLRPDGEYLVTGGSGAVGRAMAAWLLSAGAGKVVVTSRAGDAVTGCKAIAADVADRDAMAALLRSLPDLRGVIHAAGIVQDATLDRLDPAGVAAVLAPKVAGAGHLDALTRERNLDFFVLVSSTAGSLAAPGQAAYASANAWLDRLAASRRAAGYPAAAIGFGPWAAGMFTRLDHASQARLRRDGFRPMAPHRAAAALGQVLADGAIHRLVMDRTAPPAMAVAAPDDSIRAGLLAARPNERPVVLQTQLARRVTTLLGFPSGTRLDTRRPLRDLGLDSLLSVSFRNELAAAFGLELPATLLFDHPTLEALSLHMLALLQPPVHEPAEPALTDLDEAGLAALLEQEMEVPP